MTLEEKLNYCRVCLNRKMDAQTGLLCSLTSSKPDFDMQCSNFSADHAEVERYQQRELTLQQPVSSGSMSMEQKGMQKGVLGGVLMIIVAVVWFVAGWSAGYIFFYPPILFVIGLVAVVKGLVQGNYTGK